MYVIICNCAFLLGDWAELLSFPMCSSVFPLGLPQASVCFFCVPQTMADWVLLCRVSHAAHYDIPYPEEKLCTNMKTLEEFPYPNSLMSTIK